MASKKNLRRTLRARRDNMPPEVRLDKSAKATALALPMLQGHRVVAVYSALGSELDPCILADALRSQGVVLAYPRVDRKSFVLEFCRVLDRGELQPGHFGVLEPPSHAMPIAIGDIDVFLTPALSFDPDGNRLGWGKGHYDRTLAQNARALRVGICFHEQIEASLPCDPTDQSMDWVVTDTKTYTGRARSSARPKENL